MPVQTSLSKQILEKIPEGVDLFFFIECIILLIA